MATTTLVNKVRAVTKSTTTLGISDDNIVESLIAGCRFVMATAPRDMLSPYAETVTITDANGYDYTNDTVLAVERNGSISEPLPNDILYAENVSGASSLYARTALFPGHQTLRGKIYIYPAPTASAPGYFTCVKVPTLMAGSIEVFGMLEEGVILYAIARDYSALSGIWRDKAIVELQAITSTGYLADFEGAVPSYTAVTAPTLPVTPTIGTMPTIPDDPTMPVLPTAPSLRDFPSSAVLPQRIDGITLESFPSDISLPVAPTVGTLPSLPSTVTLPTAPTDPVLPAKPSTSLSAPSFTKSTPVVAPSYTDFDSEISTHDIEVADSIARKLQAQIQEFTANIQNQNSVLEKEAREYQAGIAQYGAEWQAYQSDASSILGEYSNKIQEYSAQVQATLGSHANDIQEYQAILAKFGADIEKFSNDAQTKIQDYASRVDKVAKKNANLIAEYNADVQKFSTEASVEIQKFTAETQQVASENQNDIAVYNANVQAYSAEAQATIAEFSALVQKYTAQVGAVLGEYNADINKYASESGVLIQKYQADVGAESSEFGSNLEKALAYLQEAGVRLQTMQEYERLANASSQKSNQHYVLAYQFMEQHVRKYIAQGEANASA